MSARIEDVAAAFNEVGRDYKALLEQTALATGAAQQAAGAAEVKAASAQLSTGLTPFDFGARGGGADDTQALRDAINGTVRLNWGDAVYRITSPIIVVGRSQDWRSNGARIFYDPPSPTRECISLKHIPGNSFRLEGSLLIDANRKAFDAFAADATAPGGTPVADRADFYAADLHVKNWRRSSQAFVGGNGIIVTGSYRRAIGVRLDARTGTMAVGAEVLGSQGIFGITFGRADGTSPDYSELIDAYVDYVGSDDPAYLNDQDGIRMFSERRADGLAPDRRVSIIRGGKVKNARNRSIKMQTQNGLIEGVTLEKDNATLMLPEGRTANPDIDWQVSGGQTRDITVHYDDATPAEIVRMVTTRAGETFTAGSLSGVRGYVKTHALTLTPPSVAGLSFGDITNVSAHDAFVSDISLLGVVRAAVRLRLSNTGRDHIAVRDVDASFAEALIVLEEPSSGVEVSAFATNCTNRGSGVPLMLLGSGSRIISSLNCKGFLRDAAHYDAGIGSLTRVEALGPMTPRATGVLVPYSYILASGETAILPRQGKNNGAGLLFVSAGLDRTTQGTFAVGGGVAALAAGSNITAGIDAEPETGTIRLWQPAGLGVHIKNTNASSRVITCWMIG